MRKGDVIPVKFRQSGGQKVACVELDLPALLKPNYHLCQWKQRGCAASTSPIVLHTKSDSGREEIMNFINSFAENGGQNESFSGFFLMVH